MNCLNSNNVKEIKILYIFLCTVFLILIKLYLSSNGVQFLQLEQSISLISFLPSNTKFNFLQQIRFYRKKSIPNIVKKLWEDYHIDLTNNVILKDSLIKDSIDTFFEKHIKSLNNEHAIVLFRVKNVNGIITTIGKMISLTKEDQKYYTNYIINNLYLKSDEYRGVKLSSIIFSFGIRDGVIEKKTLLSEHADKEFNIEYQNYRKYKLPITMDPLKYGKIMSMYQTNTETTYDMSISSSTVAKITIKDPITNHVIIFRNGEPIIEYKDSLINEGKTVLRIIGSNKYHYNLEGNLELVTIEKVTKYIKSLKQSDSRKINTNYITLDIETRVINGKHVPYAISWFKEFPKLWKSFYITNYPNMDPNLMIKDCIFSLCKLKFNYHKIYIHNFGKFDGIFLLKNLTDLKNLGYKVEIIINHGKLIFIDLYYKEDKWKNSMMISFRDSFQILPGNLRQLAKSFNVETQKSIFPYDFANLPNLDLYYSGKVPAYKYFSGVAYNIYQEYCKKFTEANKKWQFKYESMDYCLKDCVSLHQVITKFNELYFSEFQLNINDAPTLSSHAFKLFRTHFMEHNKVPMVFGEEHDFIRTSYTGGATDMFIPKNNVDELVYGYDVNSLYPCIMANCPMPVGNKTYFEGDIRKYEPEAFGFFYCEVTAPENLIHPIIQLHVETKGGIRTMAPTGTFKTVIFSPEMDNAIKLGYKFKILKGYTYEQHIIFDKYIESLYSLRLNYPKDHPMNFILKLLLNSLYGRFGMKDMFDTILLLESEEYKKFTEDLDSKPYIINDTLKLNENYLIQYENKVKTYNPQKEYNVNIAIASAITSYSRIFMSQFKNNSQLKLFYTDTDSVFTNLNPSQMNHLIPGIVDSKELGKLKLESVSTRAIFLAPKCYALESVDSNFKYKVKGLINKTDVNFNDFNTLLTKDSIITRNQTKWYKSLSEGTISLLEQTYTLQQTDNKRELVYNSENKLIGTKPYNLLNNKLS